METKDAGQIIKEARKNAGLTQKELAGAIGCQAASISKWESGSAFPERRRWEDLEQKLGLPAGSFWALQSEGSPPQLGANAVAVLEALADVAPRLREAVKRAIERASGTEPEPSADGVLPFAPPSSNVEPAPMPERVRKVPLISFVQAGGWTTAVDDFHPGDAEEWIDCASNVGPNAFALRVKGPSMEPEFREGEIIIVDPDREVRSGDFVVAKNGDEEATFKQYLREGGRDYLAPLNRDFRTMDMTGKDWRIVGRVLEKTKKY